MKVKGMCGRCYDEDVELVSPTCAEKPEALLGQPLGMYHCPDCGAMVIAGVEHPGMCVPCSKLSHPYMDAPMKLDLAKAREIFDKACADDTALPDRDIPTTPLPEILPAQLGSGEAPDNPYNTPDPRHRLSIPKRRRIRRARRPKHLQIPRKQVFFGKPNPDQVVARQEKVFKLRVDEGKTLAQIGAALGISEPTVRKDLLEIARMKYKGLIEKDELVLMENNFRYDQIISRWLPLVLDPDLVVGETKTDREGKEYDIRLPAWQSAKEATEVLLKAMRQREQLNGYLDTKGGTKGAAQEIGEGLAEGVFAKIQAWASKPKVVQAEVVHSEIENN